MDLCLTTRPSLVNEVYSYTPTADHSIVIVDITTKLPAPTRTPRIAYCWNKMDEKNYKRSCREFTESFLNDNPDKKSVNENWTTFKNAIKHLIEKYVPSKMIKKKCYPPWFTHKHKRLCRKKEDTTSTQKDIAHHKAGTSSR